MKYKKYRKEEKKEELKLYLKDDQFGTLLKEWYNELD